MEGETVEKKTEEAPLQPQKFVVGVQYRRAGKIYSFLTDDKALSRGDFVVVESEQGSSIGTVALPPQPVSEADLPKDIKRVLHHASKEELDSLSALSEREMEIFELFVSRVKEQSLSMKPLAAELREGEKKVILTFFAEERIDFRSLVKDLATTLHMRIEMHQVGARDEVKCRGGIGSCGLFTCCSRYLRQFQSISIQMAKNQGLTPNPAKLTGLCNKLKCCLAYENALYAEMRQRLPRVGMLVKTPQGNGKIVNLDILSEQCVVRLDEGGEARVHACEVMPQTGKVEVSAQGGSASGGKVEAKEETGGKAAGKPDDRQKPRAERQGRQGEKAASDEDKAKHKRRDRRGKRRRK